MVFPFISDVGGRTLEAIGWWAPGRLVDGVASVERAQLLHARVQRRDLPVHLGAERGEGVVGEARESGCHGGAQPAHEGDDLLHAHGRRWKVRGEHGGIRLALHELQLQVHRDALLLDAPEEPRELAPRAVAAGREVDRRLPALEGLLEPHAQAEDGPLRASAHAGAGSQHGAADGVTAADAAVDGSDDEDEHDDPADPEQDDDPECREHPFEAGHTHHLPFQDRGSWLRHLGS